MIGRRRAPARVSLGPYSYAAVPAAFAVVLLVVNLAFDGGFLSGGNLASTLAVSSPFVISALAQAFPLLSGGGGLDLSVGPVLGFTTVLVAGVLVPHGFVQPLTLIPTVLVFGLAVGALNGILVAYVRLPAIIATLGTYLIFSGLAAQVLPSPGGSVPLWLVDLTHSYGPIPGIALVYIAIAVCWILLSRTAYVRNLLSVGGDDRAAYTAGINVPLVRTVAFALAGMLSAVAGLLLTGTIQSGDATVGPIFTVTSLAAVALGGLSLQGGRGGLLGAALGGATYYLIQNLLTVANVSVFQLDVASGLVLILALALNGTLDHLRKKRGGGRPGTRPGDPAAEASTPG
ncbi:ABC transporter permease [Nakamurella endophytica]|uniref:ABC transporter permease n=1 Tax=Nakamurella endophytica TaxID=1748367 RepID=A0A917SS30_9ACTN|nr:ABC transporter permease [Nakamurella endophytica]